MKIKLDKGAYAPIRTAKKSNIFDIKSKESGYIDPHSSKAFDTGIYIEFSKNTMGVLGANPKLNLKNKIVLSNSFIGNSQENLVIRLFNNSNVPCWIEKGTKIAQLAIVPIVDDSIHLI